MAQLGERLLCKQEVAGSIPAVSTSCTLTTAQMKRAGYEPRDEGVGGGYAGGGFRTRDRSWGGCREVLAADLRWSR